MIKIKFRLLVLLILLLTFIPSLISQVNYDLSYDTISHIHAKNGIVVSEQKLATKVGKKFLKKVAMHSMLN